MKVLTIKVVYGCSLPCVWFYGPYLIIKWLRRLTFKALFIHTHLVIRTWIRRNTLFLLNANKVLYCHTSILCIGLYLPFIYYIFFEVLNFLYGIQYLFQKFQIHSRICPSSTLNIFYLYHIILFPFHLCFYLYNG